MIELVVWRAGEVIPQLFDRTQTTSDFDRDTYLLIQFALQTPYQAFGAFNVAAGQVRLTLVG